ncbi:uncharacterized protein TNCV_543241 [Trichonephila clavipes]|nr:uncharacterized protein TNCV_543241 [Trichonephila clavipes]
MVSPDSNPTIVVLRTVRDLSVKTTSFHSATHILLSSHHWRRRRLWFCVKGRRSNERLEDKPLGYKRRRMETLGVKRSWQSGSGRPEKKCKKGQRQQGAKRKFSVHNNDLPYFSIRYRRDEAVMPSTSGYNLRPRRSAKVESRPANEKRIQQGGPVRSRGSREKQQYRPYTEEQRGPSNRNTRSRSGQQHHCLERKGGAREREKQQIHLPGGS